MFVHVYNIASIMLSQGSLILVAVLVLQTKAYIVPSDTEPACPAVQCLNGGILNYTSCSCLCLNQFTGLFCETELRETKWPKGQYSLLSTVFGCPEADEYGWYKGFINMSLPDTKPSQKWKVPFIPNDSLQNTPDPHLLGPYHYHYIRLNFCTRQDALEYDTENIDLVSADWPSGEYCVFKSGKVCMNGFSESLITLAGYETSLSHMDGTLPNISFDSNTSSQLTLTFCCREDTGSTGSSMNLPADFPFLLIKVNGSSCPNVVDMIVTEERFDLVDDLELFVSEGHHEILLNAGEHKRLGLCYYAVTAVRECFFTEDNGFSYLGSVNVSADGEPCLDWYEADSSYLPTRTFYGEGFEQNQCRTSTPWSPSPTVPRCYVNHTDTGKVSLDECDVPVCDVMSDKELMEVRANKPVYSVQSSEDLGPENSVDGSLAGSPFVAERPRRKPWVQVDLEEILEVHAVRVHRKHIWFPNNFRFVGVHVGMQRWDFINYGALQCEERRNPRRAKIFRFTCYRPIQGQYVTIRNFDDSDPESTWGMFYVMEISEIKIIIKKSLCKRRMGLIAGEVRDFQVSGNQDLREYPFNSGRLLMPGLGWCSDKIEDLFYLVDTIVPSVISGLEIQGSLQGQTAIGVEEFTLQYAIHQNVYRWYTDVTSQPKIFHVDTSQMVTSISRFMFPKEILARYVRLNIVKFIGKPCLKMELIGCPKRVTRDLFCGKDTIFHGFEVVDRTGFWMVPVNSKEQPSTYDVKDCMNHCDNLGPGCLLFTHSSSTCVSQNSTRYNPHYAHWLVPKLNPSDLVATKMCVTGIGSVKNCGVLILEPVLLVSPSFPFYHGQLLECTYVINSPKGMYPKITIKDIQLNPPDTLAHLKEKGIFDISPGICEDKVIIGEYTITSANEDQYIGSVLVSAHWEETIAFEACARYSLANARGFLLDIEFSETPGCYSPWLSWLQMCFLPSAFIYSPFYPAGIRTHEGTVRWSILGDEGQYVKFHFIEIDIRSNTYACVLSYVQVSDVDKAKVSTLIGQYCSHNMPLGVIKSSWNELEIHFAVTDDGEGRGFLASYTLVSYMQEKPNDKTLMNETGCVDWVTYADSCYKVREMVAGVTWLSAESACQEEGGHLVSLSSSKETEFIHALLLEKILDQIYTETLLDFYIGLRKLDTDGRFDNYEWADGSPLTYTAWYNNMTSGQWQPDGLENERCSQLRLYSIHSIQDWHDVACAYNKIKRFICEKPKLKPQTYNGTMGEWSRTKEHVLNKFILELDDINVPIEINPLMAEFDLKELFLCNSSELINFMYRCDGFKDCIDGSDEICDNSSCVFGFLCKSGQCVSAAAHCDFRQDCQDGSDEQKCVFVACLPWEWRCDSGQCISKDNRCDVKHDCYDRSDEKNCVDCHGSAFQCYDQRCITSSRVCDLNTDCSGRFYEDESQECSAKSQPTCADWYNNGRRKNGSYLINAGIQDIRQTFPVECVFIEQNDEGIVLIQTILHHAYESEMFWKNVDNAYAILIYPGNLNHHEALLARSHCKQFVRIECSYTTRWFHLYGTGSKISNKDTSANCSCPYVGACESMCNCSQAENSEWYGLPHDASMVDSGYVTNHSLLPIIIMESDTLTGPFLPTYKTTIGPFICEQEMTALNESYALVCTNGLLANKKNHCILEVDSYGETKGCRDLSHIQDCADMICPESHARCEDGYCLPIHLLCDGTEHCSKGEDELNCTINPACNNAFHCRHSNVCIALSNICDDFRHCPYGDDERFCNVPCPESCICIQDEMFCEIENFVSMSQHMYLDLFFSLKGAYFISNLDNDVFSLANDTFYYMPYLIILNMTSSRISHLNPYQFSYNKNLIKLDLSENFITVLESNTFYGLEKLEVLNLFGNPLHQVQVLAFNGLSQISRLDLSNFKFRSLSERNFEGLDTLAVLNLSRSGIDLIQAGTFEGLINLEILDIQFNDLSRFDEGIFNGLQRLQKLYSSAFTMCCLRPSSVKENDCLPSKDEFSSCDDLMRNQLLRAFLWIIGFLALFGNFFVLLYRFIVDRENLNKTYSIFVSNLGIADLLMGVYLIILAFADLTFRGRYVWNDHLWRNGIACKLAGILSTFGSEGSVLFLCLITLDRFLVVKFPFGNVKISRNLCNTMCLCTWIMISLFALVPLSTGTYFKGTFYSRSAVCLALPLTRDRPAGWEYSTGVFIVFNLMAFVLIALGQIAIYREIYISRGRTTSSGRRHDITIARNLFMVATTDFLCWFPVGVMGVMALNGRVIAGEVYAWIAVFVLPINSALNPFIYTIGATVNKAKVVHKSFQSLRKKSKLKDKETSEITNVINSELFHFGDITFSKRITVEDLLKRRKFTPKESLLVACQMSRCLHLLHSVDMYHGNLGLDKLLVKSTERNLSKVTIITRPNLCQGDDDLVKDIKDMGETLRQILKYHICSGWDCYLTPGKTSSGYKETSFTL